MVLGSSTLFDMPFDAPYSLGIAVGTDAELTPRVALSASPYSLNSRGTVNEPANGDSLAIWDNTGATAHLLSPNGNVVHGGIGSFGGGIISGGDSTDFVVPDSLAGKGGLSKGAAGLSESGSAVCGTSTSGRGGVLHLSLAPVYLANQILARR